MSTNEVNALTRIIKFENIFSSTTDFDSNNSHKILELTPNSYYKIFLIESDATTIIGTSIIEILNNRIYSICTPSEKYFSLNNNHLYVSGFVQTTDIIIEYYEKFNFNVTVEGDIKNDNNKYNTNGILDYRQNFRAEKFTANELDIQSITPTNLTCDTIILNKWKFTATDDGNSVIISLQEQ